MQSTRRQPFQRETRPIRTTVPSRDQVTTTQPPRVTPVTTVTTRPTPTTDLSALGQRRTTTTRPVPSRDRAIPARRETSTLLSTQPSSIPQALEYEIRLLQEFTHPVGALRIINQLDILASSPNASVQPQILESTLITHYRNDIRSIRNLRSPSAREQFERKVSQRESVSRNGLYRFVVSRETPISRTEAIGILGSDNNGILGALGHTYRLRYIYKQWKSGVLLPNGDPALVDVHITFRTETRYGSRGADGKYLPSGSTRQSVSIELETPSEYPELIMNTLVQRVFTMHNGWEIPDLAQTVSSMRKILTDIGIQGPQSLQTPYDLTWSDLTYDNIVAKPHAISFKADGVRMLLVTSPVGTFFATSTMSIIPVSIPLTNMQTSTTHILDGELMYSSGQSTFWAFDLLFSDDTNFMSSSYDVRHSVLTTVIQNIGSISPPMTIPIVPMPGIQQQEGSIILRVKPITIPRTAEEFFSAVEDARRYAADNNIRTDGLIISGVNQIYSANVYKWKEPSDMTVDFFIGPITELESLQGTSVTLGTFQKGDILYHPEFRALPPIDGSVTDLTTLIGTVAEFQYLGSQDDKSIVWRFVRRRDDKGKPNSESVLNSILRLQQDPITWNAITGRSLHLMRKYHNRVKRAIYDLLGGTDVITVTDIGSGKGGDIQSWVRNNLDVVAIEPDMNNINDSHNQQGNLVAGFITRATGAGATKEVTNLGFSRQIRLPSGEIQQIPVTETLFQGDCWSATLFNVDADMYIDRILPSMEKTDALTLFNSATFLGPMSLCTLANESVKDTGVIVIMVIDGSVILQKFLSQGTYDTDLIHIEKIPCQGDIERPDRQALGTQEQNITPQQTVRGTQARGIGVGSEQFGNLGCIYIRLGDSATVGEGQTEGLVDVNVLLSILRQSGWVPDIDMYLTQEKLLGREEAMYSSAQRLLVLRRASTATHVIRQIYRPLPPGITSVIPSHTRTTGGSPWGDVVRVGVLGAGTTLSNDDISFTHALLQATNPTYRSMDNISKNMFATGRGRRVLESLVRSGTPVYIIPSGTWNMYTRPLDTSDQVIDMYPAIGSTQVTRPPGVVLMNNQGHWEPLAKKMIGDELQYIW